jgi:uncharacterized protein YbbC (DUF1343 family)
VIPRQSHLFAPLLALLALACGPAPDAPARPSEATAAPIRAGIEVLLADSLHLVRGLRVGLITNHTGIFWATTRSPGGSGVTRSTIDALYEAEGVELVALYAPEHGIRGVEEAGATIDSSTDERTGVPVHSIYGEVRKPTPAMLEGVDALLFDMQDVGARYYTYVSTMALGMEAAGERGIPFIVLDRPNPIRGDVVSGKVLEPAYSTFVGMYPVPIRHGMTPGELARLYVGEFGIDVELHVVPADGWTRDMPFDETGLPWVPPSPNIPTLESALHYPGTCLFEGTPFSVGRGTDRAFQWVGAPWVDGEALALALNSHGIEGVRFEAATFTPTSPGDGKFDGEEVHGVRLIAEDTGYDAVLAGVAMLVESYQAYRDRWEWRVAHFDRLAGTDALRLAIEAGASPEEITAGGSAEVADFEAMRAPYLVYR